ncbi:hypothetical protein PAPHI01_0775 [Pancytospora philotis]|nr:hypothetical protein PAPHI01_0775 [Pancytospora philotis]
MKFHRRHSTEIGLSDSVEAYIQTIVLKKTLESISFEYRRGYLSEGQLAEVAERSGAEANETRLADGIVV